MEEKEAKKENLSNSDFDSEKKQIKEPVFNVHKMPKGFKSGRFDNRFNSKEDGKDLIDKSQNTVFQEKSKEEKKHHGKKAGLLIVFFGVLLVIFLVYAVISYIKNPNDFSLKLPSFKLDLNKNMQSDRQENEALKNSESSLKNDNIVQKTDEETQLSSSSEGFVFETEEFEEMENINEEIKTSTNTDEFIGDDLIMSDSFVDTDIDGLNDEEESLLGTSQINVDTDGDGYDDLTELINLYNPSGSGDISNNQNIDRYSNNLFPYSIFYPKKFEIKALSDGSSVIFLISDDSFMQVLVEKNEDKKDIASWYFSRFFEVVNSDSIINKDVWSGVYSPDFYSFYLTDEKKENVYSIIYSFPENKAATYYNVFRMMINSFKLK